VAWHG